MDSKIFVLIIIAMVFAYNVVGRRHKNERTKDRKDREQEDSALRADLEKLKKRVEVLERIVTDKRERLHDEIDAL